MYFANDIVLSEAKPRPRFILARRLYYQGQQLLYFANDIVLFETKPRPRLVLACGLL